MKSLLIPVYVEGVTTRKDKSVKIILGTQELSPDKGAALLSMQNDLCSMYLKDSGIVPSEIDLVDKSEVESGGKTPSQRLRNTIYVLFGQQNEGFKDFDSFYKHKTEQIINYLKSKLQ